MKECGILLKMLIPSTFIYFSKVSEKMPDVQNLKNLDLKKHLIIQNNVTNFGLQ